MNETERHALVDEARKIENIGSDLLEAANAFAVLQMEGPAELLYTLQRRLGTSVSLIRHLINQPPKKKHQ